MEDNIQLLQQHESNAQTLNDNSAIFTLVMPDGETGEFTVDQIRELAVKGVMYDGLKAEIDRQQAERQKNEEQLREFYKLFPTDDPEQAKKSEETRKYMEQGYSLAVAYALTLAAKCEIKSVNDKNSRRSTGFVGNVPEREMYFSDEQIAGMSINEIKEKWPVIMASIKRKKG